MMIKSIVTSLFAVYISGNRLILDASGDSSGSTQTKYRFIKDGTCESYGMVSIQDADVCQAAAAFLAETVELDPDYGFTNVETDIDNRARPIGCSYSDSINRVVQRYGNGGDCDIAGYDGCFCKSRKVFIGVNELVDYDTAESRCNNFKNGQLATFDSEDEYDQIVAAIFSPKEEQTQAWIGLNNRDSAGEWTMIDGDSSYCDEYNGCDNLPQWMPDQDTISDEQCGGLYYMGWGAGMASRPCSWNAAYICELNSINSYGCTFDVLSIDNKYGSSGRWFNFDISTVNNTLGGAFENNAIYDVYNSRTKTVRTVVMSDHSIGGSVGDGYGRVMWSTPYPVSHAPGDWQQGDILSFENIVPQFC